MFWRRANGLLASLLWLGSVLALVGVLDAWRRGALVEVPLLGRMLSHPDPLIAGAPIAILGVFALALIQALSGLVGVLGEHNAATAFHSWIRAGRPSQLPGALSTANRAARRAAIVVKGASSGNLGEAISGAASLDASSLVGAYGWLHAFGWSLPVLGFVGTATGMASSIAGFRDALVNTTRIEVVVARLSQEVIPGLASAFETTVLALLAALVTFVCTSALQNSDETALQKLDDFSLDFLASTKGSATGASPDMVRVLQEISRKLDLIQELNRKMEALARLPQELQGAAKELQQSATALNQSVKKVDDASGALKGAAKELVDSITIPYKIRIEREARA